jgi:hypothetical protein
VVRHGIEQGSALTHRRRVGEALVLVAAFYALFVWARIDQSGVKWFIHLGHDFETAAHTSSKIGPQLGWQSKVGYDGQYYFAVAVDPAHARDYLSFRAGYVYGRPVLPLLAGGLGGASVHAVPYTLLAIDLLAVLAATLALSLWLRARGVSPWWAALLGLYPGLAVTVFRDLTEPLAFAFVTCAMLALQRRRRWLSAALFALALLTRETTFPFALAAVAVVAVEERTWRRPVAYFAAAFGPFIAWKEIVAVWFGHQTQQGITLVPFGGLLHYRPFDRQHWLIVTVVLVPALIAAVAALLVARRAPIEAALILATVLLYVVFLRPNDYVDWLAAGRDATPVVLATLYALGLRTRRRIFVPALVLWSLPVYVLVAALLGLHGLRLVVS